MRTVVHKTEGETLRMGQGGVRPITILIDPKGVGSRELSMGVQELPPGGGIPLHRHQDEEEVLFVYAGRMRITIEGRALEVGPESAVFIPRGAWHRVETLGDEPLRTTWTFSPPGFEEVFREMARTQTEHPGPPPV